MLARDFNFSDRKGNLILKRVTLSRFDCNNIVSFNELVAQDSVTLLF